jgi:hypothetical protein
MRLDAPAPPFSWKTEENTILDEDKDVISMM